MVSLDVINEWARRSCTKWNSCQFTRRIYRKKYRNVAISSIRSKEHERRRLLYFSGSHSVNTYPWPYRDGGFANWEEEDGENYNLISDQSGCVIKYSTSYCAWKVFELTHKWPQKKSSERLDAKRWQQFLAEAGYSNVVNVDNIEDGRSYVGIKPDEGEWGLTVWYVGGDRFATSYINKEFTVINDIKLDDYTWVLIR